MTYDLSAQRLALQRQADLLPTSILPEKKKPGFNQFSPPPWPVRCERVLGGL
jgi:hypothetical protein